MKKIYESPELITVQFNNADIVTLSVATTGTNKGIANTEAVDVGNLQ